MKLDALNQRKVFFAAVACVALVLPAHQVQADLIIKVGGCDFSADMGGTGSCGGSGAGLPADAVTLTFGDIASDKVRLTIDSSGLSGVVGAPDKISDVWFNIGGGLTFSDLTFTQVTTGVTPPTGIAPEGGFAPDAVPMTAGNVDGSGIYDIGINYSVAGGPTSDLHFNPKEVSVYDIMGVGLDSTDFDKLATSPGPAGAFVAAIHLNLTGNGNSGHYGATVMTMTGPPVISVPEPGTLALLGLALAGFRCCNRRLRPEGAQ